MSPDKINLDMSDELPRSTEVAAAQTTKPKRDWKLKNFPCSFVVRATEPEHRKLKKLSEQSGLSLSRLVIEGTLANSIKTSEQAEAEHVDVEEMIFQLKRIGINLNQINSLLHAARRDRDVPVMEAQLAAAAGEVEGIVAALRKKL